MKMEKILLTPEEAAEVLSISRSTLYDLLKIEALTSVKIGKARRIPAAALWRYVESLEASSLR